MGFWNAIEAARYKIINGLKISNPKENSSIPLAVLFPWYNKYLFVVHTGRCGGSNETIFNQ